MFAQVLAGSLAVVGLWFWNALQADARLVTGYFFARS